MIWKFSQNTSNLSCDCIGGQNTDDDIRKNGDSCLRGVIVVFLILYWTYLGFSSVVVLEKFPPSMVNPWIFTSFRFPFFARPLMVESLIEIVTWYSGHTLKNYLFDPSNCCHHCSRYHHQEAWRLTSDIYLLTKNFITVSLQLIPLHEKIELLSLKSMKITPKQ